MLELLFAAGTGAATLFGYLKSRQFVRERLRFVDAAHKPTAPVVAGAAAAVVAAPVVWLLPIVGAPAAGDDDCWSLPAVTAPRRFA